MRSAPSRVLVRLPNWLGDALMSRPLLHALRAGLPSAELTAVGPGPLLELLAGDRVWDRGIAWPLDPAAGARLEGTLDAALVLPPSFSSAWFAFRLGARQRIGYAGEGRSPLLTRARRRPGRGDLHLSREYLALGEELGLAEVPLPALAPGEAGREEARRLLGGEAGARLAVLAPGAIFGPAKRWPVERFAELGRRLTARGLTVLVCGSAAERAECEGVASGIGPAARSLAGATTLPVLTALCADAALAVCNDSGLAHLAAATGAPTVTIFGSTSSAWSAPLGPRVRVVQRPPVCSPCFQRRCRIGYRCLEAVSVDLVESACRELAA